MNNRTGISMAIGAGALLVLGGTASSQQLPTVEELGLSLSAGGGVAGFFDGDTRDFTDTGGAWEARFAVGTKQPVALELGYLGSAQDIDALGLDTDAVLIGTNLDAVARLNFLAFQERTEQASVWNPYVFGGVGWTRYDLTNADFNTSNVNESDDLISIPLGAGISYDYQRFLVDLRGEVRPVFGDDLIQNPGDPDITGEDQDTIDVFEDDAEANLHSWAASLKLGYRF